MRYENKQNLIPSEVRARIEKIYERNKNRMGFKSLEGITNDNTSLIFTIKTRLDEEVTIEMLFEEGAVSVDKKYVRLEYPMVLRYIDEIVEEAVTATQTL